MLDAPRWWWSCHQIMGSGDPGGGSDVEFWCAQAERVAADNAVLRAQIVELKGQVGVLGEKVSVLAKLAFGASSEKTTKQTPKQAPDRDDPAGGADGGEKRGRGQRKGSCGHGRRDYSHLLTREEIHDVPGGERVCRCCGAGYAAFGEETCEQIDWLVQLVRIVHRRPTYRRTCRCPVRAILVAPPVAKAITKGRFTSGFLARLLVEKFVLGRPAHPIVAALAHDGLDVAEGTLAGVFAACADLLAPLADQITQRNAAAAHLHVDETRWQVYAAVQGKNSHRWWCWVFVGPDTTVFRVAPSRSLKVLVEQLGIEVDEDTGALPDALPDALPGGRELLLSSDFYTAYQSLGLPVVGARGRGRQPVVLGAHPALLHSRRGRPPRAGGMDRGLGRAHRRALRRAHRVGRRRPRRPGAHHRRRAVGRRPGHHRRRTHRPGRARAAAAPGRGEGPRHPGPGMGRTGAAPRVPRTAPGQLCRCSGYADVGVKRLVGRLTCPGSSA